MTFINLKKLIFIEKDNNIEMQFQKIFDEMKMKISHFKLK
jgi:hypothetical protein